MIQPIETRASARAHRSTVSHTGRVTLALFDREMFSEAEAARLLQISQGTLHYWLDGGVRRGKVYKPVLRVEPTGVHVVTWAEFIEAGFLRQYRRAKNVPLPELRAVIDDLRETTGSRYPLATQELFIGPGKKIMQKAQERAGLPGEFSLVAVAGGQPLLTAAAESFIDRVDWDDNIAASWRPHNDPKSPVRMTPDIRFGLPAVGGIRTEIIWEHLESDESFDEVAEEFELTVDEVRWAHAYETSTRTA